MVKYANLKGRYGRTLVRALSTRSTPTFPPSPPPPPYVPIEWKPLALPLPPPVLHLDLLPLPLPVPSPPRLPPTTEQIAAIHRRQVVASMKG